MTELYLEDGKYLWHADHPFDPDLECCVAEVVKLLEQTKGGDA